MPLDARIPLQAIGIQAPDVLGAMAQGQQYRQNQMLAQRRADALAAAQNYMRAPPVQPAQAMQPGSAGPAITGAPPPSVNSMGAGMGEPPAAVAPAAPANAMRDITPLLQFAGDNGPIDALIAQHTRETTARATAAAQAIDDARLGDTQTRERVAYTIDRAMPMLAQLTRDPSDATLDALSARFLATPGIDRAFAEQQIAQIRVAPPAARPALIADLMNVDPQGRAARSATFPDVRTISYGAAIGGLPNSDPTAMTPPIPERAVTLTPGQVQSQENREEDRTTPVWRERNDGATRWMEDVAPNSPTFGERRGAVPIQPSPSAPRRGRDGPAPRPAQTAPRPAADRGSPPPAPPAGTPRGATRSNARGTWTWDGSRWQ